MKHIHFVVYLGYFWERN